jgi:sulfite exporter TauE/SafE
MAAFGLGTLPMLFGVGMLGGRLRLLNPHTPKLIPIFVAAVAILLVVRGMALGIPYLSPALKAAAATACH